MESKKNIIFIITAVFFAILSGNIYSSVKYHKYRGLCNQYRTELDRTTNENRELRTAIGECQSIAGSIGELSERNIQSSRDIIELTEELRSKVYELENCLGSFSQYEYYNYWDNEFGISQ